MAVVNVFLAGFEYDKLTAEVFACDRTAYCYFLTSILLSECPNINLAYYDRSTSMLLLVLTQ